MSSAIKPLVLLIMDGWGIREEKDYNAILAANTPTWDNLWSSYPHSLIHASEAAVGLPGGQMGNSEVGHMNLGAGRVIYQEFTRISRSIRTGSFYDNQTLTNAVDLAKESGKALHIFGLLSTGGVHSHQDHIFAMLKLAVERGLKRVYVHAFLDGRDTAPKSATKSLKKLDKLLKSLKGGRLASVIGRYYAMDRDHRWERIQEAYDLITRGEGEYATDALHAINQAYARGETDEFVKATAIVPEGKKPVIVDDGDIMINMNFRSDRARQITRAFIEHEFKGFDRKSWPRLGEFVCLTEYQNDFKVPVAYPTERIKNTLSEYLSGRGVRQLRVAETEKYAHVTFFFNGGIEQPYEYEDRILVPSPTDVPTYNLKPQMSAAKITDHVIESLEQGQHEVIICNFANPDMVGHSGDFEATVKAIEEVDQNIKRMARAVSAANGHMLITADHGNAEFMFNEKTGQPHTAHTINPVPVLHVGGHYRLAHAGALEDIAPTMLDIMGLDIPEEMTGQSMIYYG